MDTDNVVPMSRHYCPACGRPMRVVLVIPRFGSFPELHTYECKVCGVSLTEAAKDTNNSTNKDDAKEQPGEMDCSGAAEGN
jgi:transposase-like protein